MYVVLNTNITRVRRAKRGGKQIVDKAKEKPKFVEE